MATVANRPAAEPASREQPARPPVDLVRAGDYLVMTISLPGLKPSDFRVSLVGDRQVYLEGTTHYRHPVPREHLTLSERPYGPFQRTINLPLPVSAQGIQIALTNGVLTASLPIRRQPLPLHWVGMEGSVRAESI